MRILITGASGFAGRHVAAELAAAGHAILPYDITGPESVAGVPLISGDLCDAGHLESVIAGHRPEACVHLGGIAFVPQSWEQPQRGYQVNLLGTVNLLEAFRRHAAEARLLVVSSGEIYGNKEAGHPLREDDPMQPANPYALAKQAADLHALLCADRYHMPVMTARPDNHTGPGQSDLFVAPSFARQLAAIALGKSPPLMRVGNLETKRNFTDVRDVARAYRMILEQGQPGSAYNIASGTLEPVRHVLETLCQIAGVAPKIEIDPARYRPCDSRPTLDTTRLRTQLGWKPEIPLETTMRDIYHDALTHARNS